MSTVVFLVGAPATGKTTTARLLLGSKGVDLQSGMAKWHVAEPWIAAGHYGDAQQFDGSDRISYRGWEPTMEWWSGVAKDTPRLTLTLLDGARMGHANCLAYVRAHLPARDTKVKCVHLVVDDAALHARHAARTQSESWVKGMTTKAAKFAELFPACDVLTIDTSNLAAATVARRIKKFITP